VLALGVKIALAEITFPVHVKVPAPLATKLAGDMAQTVAEAGVMLSTGKVLVLTPTVVVEIQPEALVPDKV